MFIPRRRLQWHLIGPGGEAPIPIGGVPGEFPPLPGIEPSDPQQGEGDEYWVVGRQPVPVRWDLLNQHWTCQLVPATQPSLAAILQTPPMLPGLEGAEIVLPDLGELSSEDISRISPH